LSGDHESKGCRLRTGQTKGSENVEIRKITEQLLKRRNDTSHNNKIGQRKKASETIWVGADLVLAMHNPGKRCIFSSYSTRRRSQLLRPVSTIILGIDE
jgi:hypothetical protein